MGSRVLSGPEVGQLQSAAGPALLLPMQISLLARQCGLNSSNSVLAAVKRTAWAALCSSSGSGFKSSHTCGVDKKLTAGGDPYMVCLSVVSVEPHVRRQCALLHRGMLECVARLGEEGAHLSDVQGGQSLQQHQQQHHPQQQQKLSKSQRQRRRQAATRDLQLKEQQTVHGPHATRAAIDCAVDLCLRFVHTSCGAGMCPAALQLLTQLQHSCKAHWQHPQQPHAHSSNPPPAPQSSLSAPPTHSAAISLTPNPHPTQPNTHTSDNLQQSPDDLYEQALTHSEDGSAPDRAQAAMAHALCRCPGPASLLWVSAAHVAQHDVLPVSVARRLGYSKLPLLLSASEGSSVPLCSSSSTIATSTEAAAQQTSQTDAVAWGHLEMALECACRAVEAALDAGDESSTGLLTRQRGDQQSQQQQSQQQQQPPKQKQVLTPPSTACQCHSRIMHDQLQETGTAAASQLASVMQAALAFQCSRLPTSPLQTSQPSQQQQSQQQQQPLSHTLPLVSLWFSSNNSPCCATHLANLPSQATHWLGPHYSSALSAALHAHLPLPHTTASLPPHLNSPPTPLPTHTLLTHRDTLLMLSGVCLSAGLAAAAVATSSCSVSAEQRADEAVFSAHTPPLVVYDLLGSAVELYVQVSSVCVHDCACVCVRVCITRQ